MELDFKFKFERDIKQYPYFLPCLLLSCSQSLLEKYQITCEYSSDWLKSRFKNGLNSMEPGLEVRDGVEYL